MTEARAKLYINTGVVTDKSDIYNILRPLLKQTVSYTYRRAAQVIGSGTGWVERIVVDHPEIASYFTPLSICLNLDSFDYLQFDTTSDQLLVYTLIIGEERVGLEFAAPASPRLGPAADPVEGPPPPPRAGHAARARPPLPRPPPRRPLTGLTAARHNIQPPCENRRRAVQQDKPRHGHRHPRQRARQGDLCGVPLPAPLDDEQGR